MPIPAGTSPVAPIGNPDDILKHYEGHGVIICKPCEFAIQPSALASHLLKHQIYRSERRKLLGRLAHLKLKDPNEVADPPTLSAPIPELHVYKGARCLKPDCQYICASEKRMSQHWSDVHGERESRNVQSRPAWLQTFFRGNKIRYFEVSGPQITSPASTDASNDGVASNGSVDVVMNHMTLAPSLLDMEPLRYLLHFVESTSLTMFRTDAESPYFWCTTIPNEALKYQFLMYGLLGISAFHLSRITQDPAEASRHADASLRYQSASIKDFRELSKSPDHSNATALIAYARCLTVMRCCRKPEEGGMSLEPAQIVEFIHLIRGTIETMISLQPLLPEGNDFKMPLEEVEGLGPLNDEKLMARDAQNVANIPADILERLDMLPARLSQILPYPTPEEVWDVQAVLEANTALIAAFARAYATPTHNTPSNGNPLSSMDSARVTAVWSGLESWTRFIPDHYIHMLEKGQPAALVVYAHYCILLRRFEDRYWFINGLPAGILTLIDHNLEDNLKPLTADCWTIVPP